MRTAELIAEILKQEGVKHLSCFPTTPVLEATAAAGIRPIISRQERRQGPTLSFVSNLSGKVAVWVLPSR